MAVYIGNNKVTKGKYIGTSTSTDTGIDTSDATASSEHVLAPYTFYNANGKDTGSMVDRGSLNQTYTKNGTTTYSSGYYSGGTITVDVPTDGDGVDISDATAVASNVLSGEVFYGSNGRSTGTMINRGQYTDTMTSNGTAVIPEGYHDGTGYISVVVPSEPTTMASFESGGISVRQQSNSNIKTAYDTLLVTSAGHIPVGEYVGEGIPVFDDWGLKFSSTTQDYTISTKGKYLENDIIIQGDANLTSENIKHGVSILGVDGTYGNDTLDRVKVFTKNVSSYSDSLTFSIPLDDGLPGYFMLSQPSKYMNSSASNKLIVNDIFISQLIGVSAGCFVHGYSNASGVTTQYTVHGVDVYGQTVSPISMSTSDDGKTLNVTFSGYGMISYDTTADLVDYEFYGEYNLFVLI